MEASTSKPAFNLRNPAVKRILQEVREIERDPCPDFIAQALEDDIFEWHFVIRGPPDSDFQGGIYHGRILLPAEYPFKPPAFMMLTPSGRFQTGVKICLSISSHHPEHWQPSWSVRTALMALIAFMPTPGNGAIGSIDLPREERCIMAIKSRLEPPKFGSPGRQAVIDAMHTRMLDLLQQQQTQQTAGSSLTSQQQQQQQTLQGDQQQQQGSQMQRVASDDTAAASDRGVQDGAAAAPTQHAAAAAAAAAVNVPHKEEQQQREEDSLLHKQQQAAEVSSGGVTPPAAAATQAASPTPPQQQQQQQQQLQGMPAAGRPGAPLSPAGGAAALERHHGVVETAADKGLTLLASVLIVAIAALLVKKFAHAAGYTLTGILDGS